MSRIIALLGSPHENGCSAKLLQAFLEGCQQAGWQTEKHYLYEMQIRPCIGCEHCHKTGRCFFRDDMDILYEVFQQADSVVLASPVYFANVTAPVKAMIDRCQPYWASKYVLGKRPKSSLKARSGYYLACAGAPFQSAGFDHALATVDLFFSAANFTLAGQLLIPGTDVTPIAENSEALERAYQMGLTIE